MITQKPATIMRRITQRKSVPGVEGSSSGAISVWSGRVAPVAGASGGGIGGNCGSVAMGRRSGGGAPVLESLDLPAEHGPREEHEDAGEDGDEEQRQSDPAGGHLPPHELVERVPD